MVGSAFKIIRTNHRPDYIRQLGFKGTILIERILLQQLRHVRRDTPRLVFRQHLRRRSPGRWMGHARFTSELRLGPNRPSSEFSN